MKQIELLDIPFPYFHNPREAIDYGIANLEYIGLLERNKFVLNNETWNDLIVAGRDMISICISCETRIYDIQAIFTHGLWETVVTISTV